MNGVSVSLCLGRMDPLTQWRCGSLDTAVYIPQGDDRNDGDNEHFLVHKAPQSADLLAMLT